MKYYHHCLRHVVFVALLILFLALVCPVDGLVSPHRLGRVVTPPAAAAAAAAVRRPLTQQTGNIAARVKALRLTPNNQNQQDDDGEEIYFYDQRSRFFMSATNNNNINSTTTNHANYLDDLTPPPINWARDSILFSENPATKRNNAVVETWRVCRQYLPPVCTGAWPWRDPTITDRNPLGAIYNMIVVRIPTMGIGFVYIKNLVEGHPLIMDFGQGAFEMSPIVVFSVLALILA